MSGVAYDTGALIAADRSDRAMWAEHRVLLEAGIAPTTTAPVVAQAVRSPQQVQLRRFIRGCEIVGFDVTDADAVGHLLGRSRTSDVVDAHLALVASRRTAAVRTSDPADLNQLAAHLDPAPFVDPI